MITVQDYEVGVGNSNGTRYIACLTTTYDELVEKFGKPTFEDSDPYEKVNAEWVVTARCFDDFDDEEKDILFTIYNWKTGSVPTGKYSWHIGGNSWESVEAADDLINGDN